MATQNYYAAVHVRTASGDLATIYHDTSGPVGMPASQVRAAAEKAALRQIPDGTIEGSRVSTDGKHH
ncbi:hypothetical protein ACFV2V_13805 [Streptomyces sp. NPDC059698]|uniref:hypothetical protein n=1 Tax=unclassified Streptomyces TaxID=2593676 RepID=UPI00093AB334|nr:hypothetical protein [Streptomyces sp. CB02366]OKJ38259.1 hypothetical protein AMK24_11445 [Streptomyces sp. CB02366]